MNKEYMDRIRELIRLENWKILKTELNGLEPYEVAEIITDLPHPDSIIAFRLLNREMAKETFAHLEFEEQEDIIEQLAHNTNKLASLLNDLEPDDRTAFFEELPGKISQKLLQVLSVPERKIAVNLLGYPEDSVGRLMTPEYIAVKPYFTIGQALDHIRRFGQNSETINVIYVVDNEWKLLDTLTIKDVIMASPDQTIDEICDGKYTALNAYDDQEVASRIFIDEDKLALPVVDSGGVLLGIVTIDDAVDTIVEESSEDFQKFGSMSDAIVNPVKAGVGILYKHRILWLVALVFMNVFSGAILQNFEEVIQQVVALVFFLPLLIDSGGNAGSQTATLMIRAFAVGDVEMKDWFRLLTKELFVSLLLGLTMAVGVSLIASYRAPEVIAVVAITMVLTVICGSLIGILLPFVFTKLKLDPATACAPLITSLADILGVVIYFSVATWYFHF